MITPFGVSHCVSITS